MVFYKFYVDFITKFFLKRIKQLNNLNKSHSFCLIFLLRYKENKWKGLGKQGAYLNRPSSRCTSRSWDNWSRETGQTARCLFARRHTQVRTSWRPNGCTWRIDAIASRFESKSWNLNRWVSSEPISNRVDWYTWFEEICLDFEQSRTRRWHELAVRRWDAPFASRSYQSNRPTSNRSWEIHNVCFSLTRSQWVRRKCTANCE